MLDQELKSLKHRTGLTPLEQRMLEHINQLEGQIACLGDALHTCRKRTSELEARLEV